MATAAYERWAEALDRLPNGFPRTPAGTEILILEKLLSPEEAALASQLGGTMEPLEEIAARLGRPAQEIRPRLLDLVRRGAAWLDREGGTLRFRLAPFVVGLYESSLERMDHELAHLVEHYFLDGGAAGIMGPEPALHRVLPAQGTVKREWILPYDDVRVLLLEAKNFWGRDCICREQQKHMGHPCKFPTHVCLSFSSAAGRPGVVALAPGSGLAVRLYEWAHRRFPRTIDCRPILVHNVLEQAGFHIVESEQAAMWGLPVCMAVAC